MKIGIITFHFAFNQGAVLQSFGMQKYLELEGNEAYVINYCPDYHSIRYAAYRNPFKYARNYWFIFKDKNLIKRVCMVIWGFLKCLYLNISRRDKKRQDQFHMFLSSHLNLTSKYTSLEQLRKSPPEMDVYISGSDQIWNPEILNHCFDPAYFLDFGGQNVRRIVYAASTGGDLPYVYLTQLNNLCKNLDFISVREPNKKIEEVIGRDIHVCLDPTLLLDAEDYYEIEAPKRDNEPYIFLYGLEYNEDIKLAIDQAVMKYHCKVVDGSPKQIMNMDNIIKIRNYAPDQFLSFVRYAKCIVTNSFHGTAFSIIYKKDFITLSHKSRGKRMIELLKSLGLEYRLWENDNFSFDQEIDYNLVYEKLNALRFRSKMFLKTAILGQVISSKLETTENIETY